ncbi:UDP-N-acetylmuramate--alanine ligase [Buchnera aphidicola (Aphis glycines)]|uniref:UDP-N-acetylmuramate--L-alanine ligase n=1 Tax=Buchnera aphidicola (Aphis glycines) TaxID=1265350 RepID=A0A0M4H3E6_9GAMM|nr:UDP-N-acetylmuramate--L-alanine ligase [Buchnera aphidicola]ALD15175.1 UDP-N-acetylmuramate--alanine ligase [Buchnera aphidicola (Aphis glycines)]
MNIIRIKETNFLKNKKFNKIHFIGIGGSGMNGIALILLQLGYKISGSDLVKNEITEKLKKLGAIIYFHHAKKHIKNIDLIVISSAIPLTNPEIIEAKKKKIPILLRAEMLKMLMQDKFGIAISGTHGKTTTTSMIFDIFNENKLDPTVINGGLIRSINSYSKLGNSDYLIVEADESDSSFLYLTPKIIIVTNIEPEHMNYYNNDFNLLKKSFLKFISTIPLDSTVILCIDNTAIQEIIPKIKCKIITYGFNKNSEFCISCYKQTNFISYFTLVRKKQFNLSVTLKIPGKHNALNATAAIAIATYKQISDQKILKSLKNFQGTYRRFEYLGKISIKKSNVFKKNIMLIDDYGHHPTEISQNIKTIRTSWPKKNLIMIFQPHRYTRTYNLYDDFVNVLSQVDILFMLDVYSANENIISGADSKTLLKDIKKIKNMNVILIKNHKIILNLIAPYLNGNDIILIQGAGDIEKVANKIFIKK